MNVLVISERAPASVCQVTKQLGKDDALMNCPNQVLSSHVTTGLSPYFQQVLTMCYS